MKSAMTGLRRTPLAILLLLVASAGVTTAHAGVIDFMPKEIQDAEKPSIEAAARLKAEHPEAFHSYPENGAQGRSIHYVELKHEDATPRPLVIFVHGSPGLWRTWIRYLDDPELRSRANLIAMDRPGFGESGSGEIEPGFVRQAQALAPLLDHVQAGQRVVLVGHAWAGALIVRMAMLYPDKVTDLVLTAAPLDPALQKESWFQYPASWPPITWLLPKELVVFDREYLGLERDLTAMLPLWPGVRQRISLLLGEDDEEVPATTADFAMRMLTQAQSVSITKIPHMNHFIPWTGFDRVRTEILSHLDSPAR